MLLNKRIIIYMLFCVTVFSFSGCEILMLKDWNDTRSLEKYGDDVAATILKLVDYIGLNKEDVRRDFGEPTKIIMESGVVSKYFQKEKVSYEEIWDYSKMKGVPMINASRGTIWFYFDDNIVVAVDAF